MELVKIGLEHKDRIEAIRLKAGVYTNAMSFYSCYIWQDIFKHRLYLTEDMYAVTYNLAGDNAWYFPVGSADAKRKFIDGLLEGSNLELYKFTEEDKTFLERYFPGKFSFEECPGDSEYIYDSSEFLTMDSRKFRHLRHKCNQIIKRYDVHIDIFNEEAVSKLKEITKKWGDEKVIRGNAHIVGNEADEKIFEILKLRECNGIIITINNQVVAFIAGYPLKPDVFDLVICKYYGNIPNLGYFAHAEMIKYLADKFKYVNLEEDLGILGLNKMKKYMGPVGMNVMWKAVIKGRK